jgi:hypothetical protein
MSALPPTSDVTDHQIDVRFVPIAVSYSTIFQYESLRITLPFPNV